MQILVKELPNSRQVLYQTKKLSNNFFNFYTSLRSYKKGIHKNKAMKSYNRIYCDKTHGRLKLRINLA